MFFANAALILDYIKFTLFGPCPFLFSKTENVAGKHTYVICIVHIHCYIYTHKKAALIFLLVTFPLLPLFINPQHTLS